jgi:hypothetical protein
MMKLAVHLIRGDDDRRVQVKDISHAKRVIAKVKAIKKRICYDTCLQEFDGKVWECVCQLLRGKR